MRPDVCRIIAWQPVLTDHQAFTYQELSNHSGLPVIVQVVRLEDETRRAQGWTDTRVTSIYRKLIPASCFLRYGLRLLRENRSQIHLFGSPFENPRMMLLLWMAALMRLDCYIISEPYSPVSFGYLSDQTAWKELLKTRLRPYLYRFYMLFLRRGLKGIFAISRLAMHQYAAAGMSTERLFPFGYFVPSESFKTPQYHSNAAPHQHLRIAFVGSLIAIKGLPTLIGAVRRAIDQGADLQLEVFGPGDPSAFDFDSEHIRHAGRIPFGYTQQYLLEHDLLVLPSQYDGWGVVVNEALCAGIPVICSDRVGARVLVETFGAGLVFPAGDEEALANLLMTLFREPEVLSKLKSACAVAAKAIQPSRAASYMLEVLSAEPVERIGIPSPWYRSA